MMATALLWMTERNAFAFKAFPILYYVGGSELLSSRWTRNWKPPYFTDRMENDVSYAGHCSFPAPTARSTAKTAPDGSATTRRPQGSGNDTQFLRI
jgi:hypothetical protein